MLTWSTLVVVLCGVSFAALLRMTGGQRSLPDYGALPDFTLTGRSGQPVSLDDLLGDVWVADFIFTRCGGTCPMMTARMAEVGRRLGARPVRFVSITVDPDYDSPEVLHAYAERHGTDPDWLFLGGDRQAIYELIRGGFHLGVQDVAATREAAGESEAADSTLAAATEPFIHSTRFVLVDTEGHIRGYYDGLERAAIQELLRDASWLIDAGNPAR